MSNKNESSFLLVDLRGLKGEFREKCKENNTTMSKEVRKFVERKIK